MVDIFSDQMRVFEYEFLHIEFFTIVIFSRLIFLSLTSTGGASLFILNFFQAKQVVVTSHQFFHNEMLLLSWIKLFFWQNNRKAKARLF